MNRFAKQQRDWVLLAIVLSCLGAYIVFNLYNDHQRIKTVELERLAKQTKVIDTNLTRQLVAINLALESIEDELPDWASDPDGREPALHRLRSMDVSMPAVRTFLVLDKTGTVTLSNRDKLVGLNASQRDYFQAALQAPERDALLVSAPYQSVLGVYVMNLSRALTGPQGEFAGVVSATIDPVDIQILLNSVRYADDMRAILVHDNGTVFVSQPELAEVIGKNVAQPGSFFSQHQASKRPVSERDGPSLTSTDPRLSVMRSIEPSGLVMDKPLFVALSRDHGALFAPWLRGVKIQLAAYLLVVLLSASGVLIYRRQRLQRRLINQRLKLATEAADVGIWEFDLTTRRYHWDATMFALFGLAPTPLRTIDNGWTKLLLPGERQRMKDATRTTIQHGRTFDLTFQIQRADGQVRALRNRAALHDDGSVTARRLIGTTEDVTERQLQEADLRIAATAFESQQGMLVTDVDGVILRVNHAFCELFGFAAADVVGQTPRVLQSGQHEQAFYAALWGGLKHDLFWQGEIWNRRKNGEVLLVWLSVTAVCNEDGVATHYVATHTDITLRKAQEEEIRSLAFFDPLTRLPNRRLLQDRLHQALVNAKRDKRHLALIFLDLDNFKPVNDAFGHASGDALLKEIAQRLLACVRASDTVARLGGDEFVVLLSSIEVTLDALGVTEKIQAAIRQPVTLANGKTVRVSSSAGIAIYPDQAGDETTLIAHADAAMYQAKAAGRDRFVVFEPPLEPLTGETP